MFNLCRQLFVPAYWPQRTDACNFTIAPKALCSTTQNYLQIFQTVKAPLEKIQTFYWSNDAIQAIDKTSVHSLVRAFVFNLQSGTVGDFGE